MAILKREILLVGLRTVLMVDKRYLFKKVPVQYQAFVVKTAKNFFEQGLISKAERGAIVSAAAQSGCGQ
jgi:hypothetical protein